MTIATIDLTTPGVTLPTGPISTTVSTYGSPITTDTAAAAEYGKLVNGQVVRIPVQWNAGNPVSSAAGGPHNVSADDWINTVIGLGAMPELVIGGSRDNSFSASDAVNLVSRYSGKLYGVVLGNEPSNGGMNIDTYTDNVYLPAAKEIRAVDPNVKIIGPAWGYFDAKSIQTFITRAKGYYDTIDYHHFGCGTPPAAGDAELMKITKTYENEINQIRRWLSAVGQQKVDVQVGEFNLAWQYHDGVSGGDDRFYSAYNTAWSASVVGHILRAGGRAVAYAQQNGPLGLMVEPGNKDMGLPDGTPMPIFHGLGMFQGEHLFKGFGGVMARASTNDPGLEAYASTNGNIVLINTTSSDKTVTVRVKGDASRAHPVWETNPPKPFAAPTRNLTLTSGGQLTLSGYQVATIAAGG